METFHGTNSIPPTTLLTISAFVRWHDKSKSKSTKFRGKSASFNFRYMLEAGNQSAASQKCAGFIFTCETCRCLVFSTVLVSSMKKLLIISTVVAGERTHPGSVFSKTSVKEISVSSGRLSFPGLKKMKQGYRSNPAPSLHIFPYFFFFAIVSQSLWGHPILLLLFLH